MKPNTTFNGNEARIDLEYPRSSEIKFICVGLCDVRAAVSIRISYDFERDGYKIEQASTFIWEDDGKEPDHDWQEVSFIKAWAREKTSWRTEIEEKP